MISKMSKYNLNYKIAFLEKLISSKYFKFMITYMWFIY